MPYDPSVNNSAGSNIEAGAKRGGEQWLNLAMQLLFGGKGGNKTVGPNNPDAANTTDSLTGYQFGNTNAPTVGSRMSY